MTDMLLTTHLKMALLIYENLDNDCKALLDLHAFRMGNIKPDFTKKLKSCPHTFEGSYEKITALIELLKNYSEINPYEFSEVLGIINHFISDYFCMPHNPKLRGIGLIKHMLYEKRLANIYRKMIKGKDKRLDIDDFENIDDIDTYIKKSYNNYLLQTSSAVNDICYAVRTCTMVSRLLVKPS